MRPASDGIPACWNWHVTRRDREAVFQAGIIGSGEKDWRAAERLIDVFTAWHHSRCALCGILVAPTGQLVYDHDHGGGLLRGQLCGSCNVWEGQARSHLFSTENVLVLDRYRTLPPAVLLGIRVPWRNPDPGLPSSIELRRWMNDRERAELQRFVADGGLTEALMRHQAETDPARRR